MPETPVSATLPATLSTTPLRSLTTLMPPWPGRQVTVGGSSVFLRRTPWAGPGSGADRDAPRERALYVHGLGGASTNWTYLAGLLAVRVDGWAIDLPGFGQSPPPARGGYSILRHVRVVIEALEWIADQSDGDQSDGGGAGRGRPVHLVGNSLGGLVSLLVTARRPDLVATLSLISPAMPVYRVPPAFDRAIALLLLPGIPALAEKRLTGVSPEQQVRGLLEMCFGDPGRVPAERVRQSVEEAQQRDGQPWAGQALTLSMRGLISSYLRLGRANAWRAARSISRPTLVVWGDRDRLVDVRLAPRLASAIPDCRLVIQEGVGHVAMLEAPEPTARAVLGLLEEPAVAASPIPAGAAVSAGGGGGGPARAAVGETVQLAGHEIGAPAGP